MAPRSISSRELAAIAVRYCGLPLLIRHTIATTRATIILYHDPAPETLERHLEYLARRYSFVSLGDIVEGVRSGSLSGLPKRALAVTIDDGHRGNVALGDVFRRHNVRPTLYICSRVVGTRRHFWFSDADPSSVAELKSLPQQERLRRLKQEVGFSSEREYSEAQRQALSSEELAAVREWADIGSHTSTHPILTTCSDAECEAEISQSRREVEDLVGGSCNDFCYPNGCYTERELRLAAAAGYRSARTTDVGWNHARTDPFRLRITGVTDDATVNVLAAQLSGIPMYLRYLRAGSWSGRFKVIGDD